MLINIYSMLLVVYIELRKRLHGGEMPVYISRLHVVDASFLACPTIVF